MPFFTRRDVSLREEGMKTGLTADQFGCEGRGLVGEGRREDDVAGGQGLFGLLRKPPGLLVLSPAVSG